MAKTEVHNLKPAKVTKSVENTVKYWENTSISVGETLKAAQPTSFAEDIKEQNYAVLMKEIYNFIQNNSKY